MDNTEMHFLTFDPDEMYRDMMKIYVQNGGEALYPGDEKDLLLRGVLAILVHGFAAADNAMRMGTLRYASGGYLDLIGENRGCERRGAIPAHAKVRVKFASGGGYFGPGTRFTADGKTYYTPDYFVGSTMGTSNDVDVTAEIPGEDGNMLAAGMVMQLAEANPTIESIVCVTGGHGGEDSENDESYRERIRVFGLTNNTAGPKLQYESRAKAASSEIIDVLASRQDLTGGVLITLITPPGRFAIIKPLVQEALNDERVRPLTDIITIQEAPAETYTLKVQYKKPNGGEDITEAVEKAVEEYQNWQDNVIGQAFNPDRLMAAIYQAGATRVLWGEGSNFAGGDVEYTEIAEDNRCNGTITLEVIS